MLVPVLQAVGEAPGLKGRVARLEGVNRERAHAGAHR